MFPPVLLYLDVVSIMIICCCRCFWNIKTVMWWKQSPDKSIPVFCCHKFDQTTERASTDLGYFEEEYNIFVSNTTPLFQNIVNKSILRYTFFNIRFEDSSRPSCSRNLLHFNTLHTSQSVNAFGPSRNLTSHSQWTFLFHAHQVSTTQELHTSSAWKRVKRWNGRWTQYYYY